MSNAASVARLRNEMEAITALFNAVTGPLVFATLAQEREASVSDTNDDMTVVLALRTDPAFRALVSRANRFILACKEAGVSLRISQ